MNDLDFVETQDVPAYWTVLVGDSPRDSCVVLLLTPSAMHGFTDAVTGCYITCDATDNAVQQHGNAPLVAFGISRNLQGGDAADGASCALLELSRVEFTLGLRRIALAGKKESWHCRVGNRVWRKWHSQRCDNSGTNAPSERATH